MTDTTALTAIVLAAGHGTRMRSQTPKVLHRIAGRTLVDWAVGAALEAGAARVVVVTGHDRERVEAAVATSFGDRVRFAYQPAQRGTGHAVQCAMPALADMPSRVLILYGDCPLLEPTTLRALVDETARANAPLGLITMSLPNPTGYGRLLRDSKGRVRAIREHKDATQEERAILEVNPGVYAIDSTFLTRELSSLQSNNAQGELYLTDLVQAASGGAGVAEIPGSADELRGVNDRADLATCARIRRGRINEALARSGVSFDDLDTTFVDASVVVEPDAHLGANVHLRGATIVRAGARLDVGCVLTDVEVASGATLHPYTVASESRIGEIAEVGPFSHLRAETELGRKSKVGNFTETKKTRLGEGAKVNHLAYVGNGEIGARTNVGAGTIFCNYDGFLKHTTVLEDDVFIGSDSQLVAPVRVGQGAYVASGTTVTRDVPADALAISRVKQDNKEGLAKKLKARGQAAKDAAKKATKNSD